MGLLRRKPWTPRPRRRVAAVVNCGDKSVTGLASSAGREAGRRANWGKRSWIEPLCGVQDRIASTKSEGAATAAARSTPPWSPLLHAPRMGSRAGSLRRERWTGPPRRGRCVRELRRQEGDGPGVVGGSRGRSAGELGQAIRHRPRYAGSGCDCSTESEARAQRPRPPVPPLLRRRCYMRRVA